MDLMEENIPLKVVHEGHFDAAHNLTKAFGKCVYKHGHTYKVVISVAGVIGDDGVVVDFRDLKKTYEGLDHSDLNNIIPLPTAEAISLHILGKLLEIQKKRRNINTIQVRLWEGSSNYVETETY